VAATLNVVGRLRHETKNNIPATTAASLDALLALYIQRLPAGFLPAGHVALMMDVARQFAPFSGAILEYHLGMAAPNFDMFIRVTRSERKLLAAQPLRTDPGWQPIAAFSQAWLDPASALFNSVENLWLSFDLQPESGPGSLVPAVSFDTDRHQQGDQAWRWQSLTEALKLLQKDPLSTPLFALIEQLLTQPGQLYYYVGAMLSRPANPLRVSLIGLTSGKIEPLLAELGWPGDVHIIREVLALAPAASRLNLAVSEMMGYSP